MCVVLGSTDRRKGAKEPQPYRQRGRRKRVVKGEGEPGRLSARVERCPVFAGCEAKLLNVLAVAATNGKAGQLQAWTAHVECTPRYIDL